MKNKLITIGCFVGIVLIISLMVFLKLASCIIQSVDETSISGY